MKVAVTYENGMIFQHFGHTQQFKVYDIEDGKIVSEQVVGTNGQGHGALAGKKLFFAQPKEKNPVYIGRTIRQEKGVRGGGQRDHRAVFAA